jgi:DNA-directed RNA polymerase subunit RPC12/RpoP
VSLKILIAGCLPKDRGRIESVVKNAFGDIPESDPWNVSLVKLGDSWSISLEGPKAEFQGLSLTAPEDRLQETIAEALATGGTAARATSPLPSLEEIEAAEGLLVEKAGGTVGRKATDGGDRYDCPACGRPFKVIYAAQPREAKVSAPVACPHCWEVKRVSVPESAAATQEYRAEAVLT